MVVTEAAGFIKADLLPGKACLKKQNALATLLPCMPEKGGRCLCGLFRYASDFSHHLLDRVKPFFIFSGDQGQVFHGRAPLQIRQWMDMVFAIVQYACGKALMKIHFI
jgi:hypothetical protein